MPIKLQIQCECVTDVEKLSFVTHMKDNYATNVIGAIVEDQSPRCSANFTFDTVADAVDAILDLRQTFEATWRMTFEP